MVEYAYKAIALQKYIQKARCALPILALIHIFLTKKELPAFSEPGVLMGLCDWNYLMTLATLLP